MMCSACGTVAVATAPVSLCRKCAGIYGDAPQSAFRDSAEALRSFDRYGNSIPDPVAFGRWQAAGFPGLSRTPLIDLLVAAEKAALNILLAGSTKPKSPDLSDWRVWQASSIQPGECKCGIQQKDCRYHR